MVAVARLKSHNFANAALNREFGTCAESVSHPRSEVDGDWIIPVGPDCSQGEQPVRTVWTIKLINRLPALLMFRHMEE
jgi:hypothetical protein